ncbi:hypothetical protein [Paenibacillus amylolyticus]|uniref:hypothetical protein n=1 Tax=Paenibacillus amylolyticus TaxID=1451 RepID=UPI003EBF2FB5
MNEDNTTAHQWSCSQGEARVSSKKMGRKTEERSIRFSGTSFNPEVAPGIAEQWFPKMVGTEEGGGCLHNSGSHDNGAGRTDGRSGAFAFITGFSLWKSESKKSGDNGDLKLFCPRSGQV